MADFRVDGAELVLHLSPGQKVLGLHGDIRVPLTAVRSARVVEKPWVALRGRRMAGTALRGVAAVGTWIHGDRRYDFNVIRRYPPAAVVLDLGTGRYDRILVGMPEGVDAVAEAHRIADAAGIARSA